MISTGPAGQTDRDTECTERGSSGAHAPRTARGQNAPRQHTTGESHVTAGSTEREASTPPARGEAVSCSVRSPDRAGDVLHRIERRLAAAVLGMNASSWT